MGGRGRGRLAARRDVQGQMVIFKNATFCYQRSCCCVQMVIVNILKNAHLSLVVVYNHLSLSSNIITCRNCFHRRWHFSYYKTNEDDENIIKTATYRHLYLCYPSLFHQIYIVWIFSLLGVLRFQFLLSWLLGKVDWAEKVKYWDPFRKLKWRKTAYRPLRHQEQTFWR